MRDICTWRWIGGINWSVLVEGRGNFGSRWKRLVEGRLIFSAMVILEIFIERLIRGKNYLAGSRPRFFYLARFAARVPSKNVSRDLGPLFRFPSGISLGVGRVG